MVANQGLYAAQTADVRSILRALGMGEFNATMVIPYMMIPVATTDPDMAQIQLVVELIQRRLNSLGARLEVTGRLDVPTLAALRPISGPDWARMSWAELCQALIANSDIRLGPGPGMNPPPIPSRGRGQALSGLPILPDIPGGALTYLILAGVGWHFWKKRRGR